jgi:hypothetical protein
MRKVSLPKLSAVIVEGESCRNWRGPYNLRNAIHVPWCYVVL